MKYFYNILYYILNSYSYKKLLYKIVHFIHYVKIFYFEFILPYLS